MKKPILLINMQVYSILLILFVCFSTAYSQETYKNKPDKRFFIGGNLGLQLGSITYIDVSPLVGYKFTENFAGGIGLSYQYFKNNNHSFNYAINETNIYGGRIFARYYFNTDNFLENIFLHTEFEVLNLDAITNYSSYFTINVNPEINRVNVPAFFVGAGLRQPISGNSYITIIVLWDLIEDEYSPYVNPVIRVGADFGI